MGATINQDGQVGHGQQFNLGGTPATLEDLVDRLLELHPLAGALPAADAVHEWPSHWPALRIWGWGWDEGSDEGHIPLTLNVTVGDHVIKVSEGSLLNRHDGLFDLWELHGEGGLVDQDVQDIEVHLERLRGQFERMVENVSERFMDEVRTRAVAEMGRRLGVQA